MKDLKLYKHQVEPIELTTQCLLDINSKVGRLIIGPTGCGKTWVMAMAIKNAQKAHPELFTFNEDDMFRMHPIVVITPKNAIIEQQRTFTQVGLKDIDVISIDSLRSAYGELYIKWETVKNPRTGEEDIIPVWDKSTMPKVIFLDECQNAKSQKSLRQKILIAYVKQGGKLILVSATPFQKGSEAKLIAIATGLADDDTFNWWVDGVTNWQTNDNSPAAVKRIKQTLEANGVLINISNVRYPFKPITRNWLIEPTDKQRQAINSSYARYCEKRAELGKHQHTNMIALWQAQRVMRLECELERVPNICVHAREHELKHGKAVIIASNFIPTLNACRKYLINVLGVKPEEISMLTGNVSGEARQQQIDNFQTGKSLYFLTTLKSGGTALNLNHSIDGVRPRVIILPPTWSVYELIQVLGRAQRITNLSAVIQIIAWFSGTVEEEVASRMEKKYDCIRELLNNKDDYISNIFEKALGNSDLLLKETTAEQIEESLNFIDTDDGQVIVKGNKKVEEAEDESFFDLDMLCEGGAN